MALVTEWIPWRHDHPMIPHEPGGLLISEWKILPMLIVFWSLIQNVSVTVLSNVAILFLLSVLWKASVLIPLWILYHSVCTACCCLTFYGALKISPGSFVDVEFPGTFLHWMLIMGLVMWENFFCSWQGELLQHRDECHPEPGRSLLQPYAILWAGGKVLIWCLKGFVNSTALWSLGVSLH